MLKDIAWTTVGQVGSQAIQIVTTLILARFLVPNDFGLIGISTLFYGLASTVNQLGFTGAIVHRPNLSDLHLSSCFLVNLGFSLVTALITLLLAGEIARFFHAPEGQRIIESFSVLFIFGGLRTVQLALLVRSLSFRFLAFLALGEVFLQGLIAVPMAAVGFGAWSIVIGRLIASGSMTLCLWLSSSWRPKFRYSRTHFAEIFSFGRASLGSNLLTYAIQNVDNLIVGRTLGTASLGIYGMAYNLATVPTQKISSIISLVAFPKFSREAELKNVKLKYESILATLSSVTFPILVGGAILARPAIIGLVGNKWEDAIIPFQILCIAGSVKSLTATVGSVFQSQGKPQREFLLDLLSIILMVFFLLAGMRWGIKGVAAGVAFHSVIMMLFFMSGVARILKTKFGPLVGKVLPSAIASMGMGIPLWFVYTIFLNKLSPWVSLGLIPPLGILIYYLFMRNLYPSRLEPLLNVMRKIFGNNAASV